MKLPRLTAWIFATAALLALIGLLSPQQLPVSLYKLSLVTMAAVVAYWLDRALFPYARPGSYLCSSDWHRDGPTCDDADHAVVTGYEMVFAAAMLRRAIIVAGAMLAIGLGA
ncbi:putative holin [Pandoraea apista]|uniref:Membrane protein n=1 Tax=Pandoraea apista TaxID=93218 RepID=A0A5E5P6G7_9BURK|nr:membrane protein [Pandoraea apista]